MTSPAQPNVSPAQLEVVPPTPFVAVMRSRPARAFVWLASAMASGAALTAGALAMHSGNAPLAAVFGGLAVPLGAGVMRIGHTGDAMGDLFPENRFYLGQRSVQLGTAALTLAMAGIFVGGAVAIAQAAEKTKANKARTDAMPTLAPDTLVPASVFCGTQTSDYVFPVVNGVTHKVPCGPQ